MRDLLRRAVCPAVLVVACAAAAARQTDEPFRFDRSMSQSELREAGLAKLTPAELAFLEQWIERNRPLDENRARRRLLQDLPDVVESRIAGTFAGWSGDTIFTLVNGQVWQQASDSDLSYYLHGPEVRIYRTPAGYRMRVDGVDQTILVQRVK